MASWAGSLMLKHKHPDFISDVYTMFETVGAKLYIGGFSLSCLVQITL